MKKISKRKKTQLDFPLLITVLLLVFIGIIMVFSSSWPEAIKEYGNSYFFVKRQIIFAIIGLAGMIFAANLNYKIYEKWAFPIYVATLATVPVLLFTPLGQDYLGAKRWINLGVVTFMPGDVIKIGAVIFFARTLVRIKGGASDIKDGAIPALVVLGISVGSILIQRDLGTSITLGTTLVIMLVVAGFKIRYLLVLLGLVSSVGAYILIQASKNPNSKNAFRVRRITSFLDPFADPMGSGWQAVQSLYALGSGGILGLGLGKSKQKFFYIPESYNDFIFAIIGEEFGFIGAALIIGLYIVIIIRGVKIAIDVKEPFGFYLAIGLTALISIQSLIHIAVVTSSIPTTGITLPFISYGGTSLVIYMSAVGVLLNISKYKK